MLAVAGLLAQGGCSPTRPAAVPTPLPTLMLVTVTPGVPPTPTIAVATVYVVQQGDTISGIATRFGVAEDELMQANNLTDRNRLDVGQELRIPAPEP